MLTGKEADDVKLSADRLVSNRDRLRIVYIPDLSHCDLSFVDEIKSLKAGGHLAFVMLAHTGELSRALSMNDIYYFLMPELDSLGFANYSTACMAVEKLSRFFEDYRLDMILYESCDEGVLVRQSGWIAGLKYRLMLSNASIVASPTLRLLKERTSWMDTHTVVEVSSVLSTTNDKASSTDRSAFFLSSGFRRLFVLVNLALMFMMQPNQRAPMSIGRPEDIAGVLRTKRLSELMIALPIAVILSPLFIFLCTLSMLEKKRFFERIEVVGRFKEPVFLYTFSKDPVLSQQSSRFIIDRLARAMRLWWLPALINVFAGNISLVGSRLQLFEHAGRRSSASTSLPIREFVNPGLTSWSRLSCKTGDIESLDNLDDLYVATMSPLLDVKILLKALVSR